MLAIPPPLIYAQPPALIAPVLASPPLPDPKTLGSQSPDKPASTEDPLIAKGWQKGTYIGAALVLLIGLIVVGYFSRRIEDIILIGLIVSVVIIAGFLLLSV
jgi:hypothetical protein